MSALYDDLIMDHIRNARNYRALDDVDCRATRTNPLCGDEMSVGLKFADWRIVALAFQCTCCGISMASASIMTGMIAGRTAEEAKGILREFVAMLKERIAPDAQPMNPERMAMLETVRRFPARTACAALPWETLESALGAV